MSDICDVIERSKKIVIKIGSALVTDEATGSVRRAWLESLAADIADLRKTDKQIILVTSGAIALGRKAMGVSPVERPGAISLDIKQAAASVGQLYLSRAYDECMSIHGIVSSIVLLTPRDTEDRRSHLNARATLSALMTRGIVPVINENDTVSTAEIRFGDNDRLAARVAQMIGADLLIQLSTTDGLYTADPRLDPSAEHVAHVKHINEDIQRMAGDALAGVSTGGMKSKIIAAQIATLAGVPMIIAKGTALHALSALKNGARATLFHPQGTPLSARKKWIQAHVKPTGTIVIDEGAQQALKNGKSLLPAGIVGISGTFQRGDAVTIINQANQKLAVGLTGYDMDEAQVIMGHHSHEFLDILGHSGREEFIHRDDLVLLSP